MYNYKYFDKRWKYLIQRLLENVGIYTTMVVKQRCSLLSIGHLNFRLNNRVQWSICLIFSANNAHIAALFPVRVRIFFLTRRIFGTG